MLSITFDAYVSERKLRADGAVDATLAALAERGVVYEAEGARWFRSTDFGDDKDRPLVKSGGEFTYFGADVAYHRDKLARGFDRVIDVWGADHHGHIPRMKAALTALGLDANRLEVVLVQVVSLTRAGVPVRMGKRSGSFVTLREVVEEVGADATRFFLLMRKSDAQLEFDLDLAKQRTAENPVFYVQYGHARVASIFRQAAALGLDRAAASGRRRDQARRSRRAGAHPPPRAVPRDGRAGRARTRAASRGLLPDAARRRVPSLLQSQPHPRRGPRAGAARACSWPRMSRR